MTIAACYVSPEGVAFGADSTTTYPTQHGNHYLNHSQKLFEIGEQSTLALVTWGLGGLAVKSHRMLVALLGDDLAANRPADVTDVANRWARQFFAEYVQSPLVVQWRILNAMAPHGHAGAGPNVRTLQQEELLKQLTTTLLVGFCLGGYVLPSRTPFAFDMVFQPHAQAPPVPTPLPVGTSRFYGAPNMVSRLIHGYDAELRAKLLTSGKWSGTTQELDAFLNQFSIASPALMPMREALDYAHSCIASTIKAFKFSQFPQICGGPIELGVITCDRRFRWVRHKQWDSAVTEGEP
jgi:hypothetical protein